MCWVHWKDGRTSLRALRKGKEWPQPAWGCLGIFETSRERRAAGHSDLCHRGDLEGGHMCMGEMEAPWERGEKGLYGAGETATETS